MAKTGFNKHDIARNACQLFGAQAHQGYDWWWHSFTGYDAQTGQAKPFFIEFFLCNPALGGEEPVFGQIPGRPAKPSYLMVKAGAWGEDAAQLHRFWGWKKINVDWGVPFSVEADDCFLTEDHTHGSVKVENASAHPEWMCADGEMSWDLRISKITAFNVGFGADEVFRHAEAFEMFWHAEGMKTEYQGEVVWNGRRYIVRPEDCYGYADKNWGRDFTSPWVWLSSNNLTSELTGKKLTDSVFDIGGGRPKVGHLALPRKLLSAFWYEGKPYEFNFSKAWTRVHTEFDCKETNAQIVWHVDQRSTSGRMITDVTCQKKDMLLVNYESPDGAKRHTRLWNGGNGVGTIQLFDRHGNLVDRIHAENIGCEYGEYGNYIIRNERESEHRQVEELVRESFWNVYRPGCLEHYVLHCLRKDPAFVPELDFVMEAGGRIIGQCIYMRATIKADDGRDIPIVTMGPIGIHPDFKRQGYGKALLDYSLEKAAKMGFGAICFEGNIDFYGKSGFTYASNFGIRYHGLPEGEDASFFLCKELIPGYLDGITGEYATPDGYFVDESACEEFDKSFPPKEKLKLPGQLW